MNSTLIDIDNNFYKIIGEELIKKNNYLIINNFGNENIIYIIPKFILENINFYIQKFGESIVIFEIIRHLF